MSTRDNQVCAETASVRIAFRVNGEVHDLERPPLRRLLEILREDLCLTGAKPGCLVGRCGACTVVWEGRAVPACLVFAYQLEGTDVVTVEGLRENPVFERVTAALAQAGAVQCGYCGPGIATALTSVLAGGEASTEDALIEALSGNLCRCSGYEGIRRAVSSLLATGAASSDPGAT